MRVGLAAARSRLVAAARFLVDRRPGARLGFLGRRAAILIAVGDMFGFALLFVGVRVLVSTGHVKLLSTAARGVNAPPAIGMR